MPTSVLNHPFFNDLDPIHRKEIEKISETVKYREGDRIFHQGDPDDRFCLIQEGTVALQAYAPGRGGKTIDTAGPGDYVGWSWIVPPFRAHYDAVAVEPVVAVSIDAKALRDLCEKDHSFGYHVMNRIVKMMEHRLQGTRLLLLDLYGTSQ